MPVVLVLGYGLALADVFTEAALKSGYDVAIVARDGAKLQRVQDSYAEKGKKVIGFPFDLSDSVGVIGLVNRVWEIMGGIDACLYNPTVTVAYTSTPEEFSKAANINITSVHTSFSALLPLWRGRGTGGIFMLSGGGLGDDGAKGAAYGLQFGAAAKAYFRNFAESTHATFVSEGIYTVCWKVSSLVFGGTTIPDSWNANPDEAIAFRAKLLSTFSATLSGATKATWQPVVTITADQPVKAIQFSAFSSDLKNLKLTTISKPRASPGNVVVKVKAAAANPLDTKVISGHMNAFMTIPLPFTPGYDFSGIIEEVAEGDPFSVGEEVFCGFPPNAGAFAEFISVPVSVLSRKPPTVSHELAAGLGCVGTTAYQICFLSANIQAGSRVLILGGSSAVGSIAIQLAKSRGAWVATTASTRNVAYTSQFGPDKIVDYKVAQYELDPELKDLDAVIDTVGAPGDFAKVQSNGVLKSTGAFVSIANVEVGFDPKGHAPLSFASFYFLQQNSAQQDELVALVASGKLKVVIDKSLPFGEKEAQELLTYQESGQSRGKNVLVFK